MRVKTRFEATENIGKTARKIERNTRRMNQSIQRGFRKSTKEALGFKSVMKGILGASLVSSGINALGQGVQFVAKEFIGFDDAITAAAANFKDIDRKAANFDQQIKRIGKSARETAAATLFTPEQAAKGLLFMAKAGFTSEEAMKGLISMIRLATATGEDFAQVADQSSDLLGAFAKSFKDPSARIQNLNRLNDVLVATATTANVTVNDMFETMKQIGPVSGLLSAELEEVAALTAILGNSGLKGSDAMTSLKNAYLRLAAPVGKGADLMKIFGLTLKKEGGGVKKLTDLLAEFTESAKFKALGKVEQAQVFDAIFGKRAIAGQAIVINSIKNVREFEKKLKNAGGTAKEISDIMQKSLGGRIKILGSTLTELGFKVLDPFENRIKNNITSLTEFFRLLEVGPTIRGLELAASVFSGIAKSVKESSEPIMRLLAATDKILTKFESLEKLLPKDSIEFLRKSITKALPSNILNVPIKAAASSLESAEKREGLFTEVLRPIIEPFLPERNPINVNVENNISAKDVNVDTTVKAPGTSGKVGINKI